MTGVPHPALAVHGTSSMWSENVLPKTSWSLGSSGFGLVVRVTTKLARYERRAIESS